MKAIITSLITFFLGMSIAFGMSETIIRYDKTMQMFEAVRTPAFQTISTYADNTAWLTLATLMLLIGAIAGYKQRNR